MGKIFFRNDKTNSNNWFHNSTEIKHNHLYIEIDKEDIIDVTLFLKTNKDTKFRQLIDITAVDYPEQSQRFKVVYLFLSHEFNQRMILSYFISENEVISSLTSIFPAANWMEREVFDMYGVKFKDHLPTHSYRVADCLDFPLIHKDWTAQELVERGESVYAVNCVACHQTNGQGIPGIFPALAGSDIVMNQKDKNIDIGALSQYFLNISPI